MIEFVFVPVFICGLKLNAVDHFSECRGLTQVSRPTWCYNSPAPGHGNITERLTPENTHQ